MSLFQTPVAFLRKDLLEESSYRLNFFLGIGSTLVTLLFLVFVSEFVSGLSGDVGSYPEDYTGDYFSFALLGLVMHGFLGATLQQYSSRIRQAQLLGTLEALLATRTRLPTIILCLPLYPLLLTAVRGSAFLLFGALFFGLEAHWAAWPQALVILLLTVAAFACLGVATAGLTIAFKRTEPINTLIGGLSLFLGGIYYPLSVLPEWLQGPAHFLPITPGLQGLRTALLGGGGWGEVAPYLFTLLGFIAVMLPVGLGTFRWGVRRAMRDGTLTQY